ncbi:MAG: hypothetical protein M0R51_18190 [Clostridia bacterium]|jgi:hypothetical protein|nr:hypothetical protein [Clostridia bacterium]
MPAGKRGGNKMKTVKWNLKSGMEVEIQITVSANIYECEAHEDTSIAVLVGGKIKTGHARFVVAKDVLDNGSLTTIETAKQVIAVGAVAWDLETGLAVNIDNWNKIQSAIEAEKNDVENDEFKHVKALNDKMENPQIAGLDALDAENEKISVWHDKFNAAMERGDGVLPSKPEDHTAELNAKYPVAAAYRKARAYSNAANYGKSVAGKRAMFKILDGADYAAALNDMETEWTNYCDKNVD